MTEEKSGGWRTASASSPYSVPTSSSALGHQGVVDRGRSRPRGRPSRPATNRLKLSKVPWTPRRSDAALRRVRIDVVEVPEIGGILRLSEQGRAVTPSAIPGPTPARREGRPRGRRATGGCGSTTISRRLPRSARASKAGPIMSALRTRPMQKAGRTARLRGTWCRDALRLRRKHCGRLRPRNGQGTTVSRRPLMASAAARGCRRACAGRRGYRPAPAARARPRRP